MRILSGKYKGRVLLSPKIKQMRPTSSRLREAIFDLMRDRIEDAQVLDVFCGVGGIGLEALSRGAKSCVFVEKNPQVLKCLRQNLRAFEVDALILSFDAIDALKLLQKKDKAFDFIYLDPPYQLKSSNKTYSQATLNSSSLLLKENARLIVEESSKQDLETPELLELLECRKYGNTSLHIFAKR